MNWTMKAVGQTSAILLLASAVISTPQNSIQDFQSDGQRFAPRRPREPFSITDSMVDFTVDLSTNHLQSGNAIFSPLSVTSLLNLLLLGATNNTYDELRNAMRYPADADDFTIHKQSGGQLLSLQRKSQGVTVNIASRIFANNKFPIQEEYQEEARDFYQASVEATNFARRPNLAVRRINTWVNDHTKGKIPQLLTQPLPAATQMVAANVVYFNSLWRSPFNPEKTLSRDFHVSPSETVTTEIMSQRLTAPHGRFPELGFEVVGLPYSGASYAMFVFLPDEGTEAALEKLERHLTAENLKSVLSGLLETTITVEIPRFKMRHSLSLRDALQGMGVHDLFSARRASLGRMTDSNEPLFLDDVIHQAVIDVHERGTEAAAATAGVISRGLPQKFTANKPFLFMIRDNKTGVPLFWGRFVRPEPDFE